MTTFVRSLSTISGLDNDIANAVNDKEKDRTLATARTCICTCAIMPLAVSGAYCTVFYRMWF